MRPSRLKPGRKEGKWGVFVIIICAGDDRSPQIFPQFLTHFPYLSGSKEGNWVALLPPLSPFLGNLLTYNG